jgi:hypothetical protein
MVIPGSGAGPVFPAPPASKKPPGPTGNKDNDQ